MRTGKVGDAERDSLVIDTLLEELGELRELDRRRRSHAPGSLEFAAATEQVDELSNRLMDRARDLQHRRQDSRTS